MLNCCNNYIEDRICENILNFDELQKMYNLIQKLQDKQKPKINNIDLKDKMNDFVWCMFRDLMIYIYCIILNLRTNYLMRNDLKKNMNGWGNDEKEIMKFLFDKTEGKYMDLIDDISVFVFNEIQNYNICTKYQLGKKTLTREDLEKNLKNNF